MQSHVGLQVCDGHLTPMRREISIEQIGSAIIRSYFCISRAEMITPTLPRVSAMMCSRTPATHTHVLWCPNVEREPQIRSRCARLLCISRHMTFVSQRFSLVSDVRVRGQTML